MLSKPLKKKILSGFIWSVIEKFGQQSVHLVIGVFIARLLTPSDYGLIGMIALFLALSNAFIDGGFGHALIQKKDVSNADYSTVFLFNLFISLSLYILLFIFAPIISNFYGQDELISIIRITSIGLISNSLGLIQMAYLQRNLFFKKIAFINILSQIISASIGLILAIYGFGVYAIVVQSVFSPTLRTIFAWIITKYHVKLIFNKESFFSLFSFGSYLLLSHILNVIFNNIYLVVIGKLYKVSDVGYYSQGKKLQETVSISFNQIIQRILFPFYSSIQNEVEKINKITRLSFALIGIFYIPLIILLIYIAKLLIVMVLTDKWIGSVIFFQILGIAGLIYPINSINVNILKSRGKSKLLLVLDLIKKTIIIISIIILIDFGIYALVWGKVISEIIGYFLVKYYSGKEIHYSILENIIDIGKYIFFSILSLIITHLAITSFENLNDIKKLISIIILYSFIYFALNMTLNKKILFSSIKIFYKL